MKLRALGIQDAYVIEPQPVRDERGDFARVFDANVMRRHGLVERFDVNAIARNTRAGTIRGLHLQRRPYGETKIVRVLTGAAYDVIADLRADSPTFGCTVAVELDGETAAAVYVPEGCAHGYQTRRDATTVAYAIAGPYVPEYATGVRYDDPDLAVTWPLSVTVLSARDASLPGFAAFRQRVER